MCYKNHLWKRLCDQWNFQCEKALLCSHIAAECANSVRIVGEKCAGQEWPFPNMVRPLMITAWSQRSQQLSGWRSLRRLTARTLTSSGPTRQAQKKTSSGKKNLESFRKENKWKKRRSLINHLASYSPQSAHQFELLPLYVLIESVPVERSWDLKAQIYLKVCTFCAQKCIIFYISELNISVIKQLALYDKQPLIFNLLVALTFC